MTTAIRLSECIYAKDGQIQFNIPDGVLPGFLIEAFNVAATGDMAECERLLTAEGVAFVDRMRNGALPGGPLASLILAILLQRMGRYDQALQRYQTLASLEPHPLLFNEQAVILHSLGRFSEAVERRRRALDLMPHERAIREAYSMDLIQAGFVREGLAVLQELVEQGAISPGMHSNLLFYSHCLPEMDQAGLLELHRQWARTHAPVHLAQTHHPNDLDLDRRIRIGYISADFHRHSANLMFEAMLTGRDPSAVVVFGYGSVDQPDDVTDRFASMMDAYRPIQDLDDGTVADLIRQDEIDILVEVAGHTGGHRLTVLAHKPAPIQVDWGGINTTGMDQVDYRLTDSWLDPPGIQSGYVETLVHLPGGFSRFAPLQAVPPVGPLPAMGNGVVTFGSFNGHMKINTYILGLWAQVLRHCPGSRMLVKYRSLSDEGIRRRLCAEFERHGISSDRIHVEGWKDDERHWDLYNQVDVCLDTYPYNGCITTLEALWMGIPVVSLAGRICVSRVGLSAMACAGLAKFVASSGEEYVAKAVALTRDLETLAKLRRNLRQVMAASPLHDVRGYARELEAAYRQMWRRWCQTRHKTQEARSKTQEAGV